MGTGSALWLVAAAALISTAWADGPDPPMRVAVIGAGIGGSAAAYWLSRLHPAPEVHVFECCTVGGRTREFMDERGQLHELGASILHDSNLHALHLATAMGLTPESVTDSGGGGFSIWDGSRIAFSTGGRGWWDALRMAARWGTAALRWQRLSKDAGARFGAVYAMQHRGEAFTGPFELLQAMGGLGTLTQRSTAQMMQEELRGVWGFGAATFARELAGAVNRVNYNQPNEALNALAGLVSFLPAAAPAVWRVREGNAALSVRLLRASSAALHAGCAVTALAPAPGGGHALNISDDCPTASQGQLPDSYDAVVLATPLELSGGLALVGYEPRAALPPRAYQTTVCTFVRGWINPQYFGVASMPDGDVLVTDDADTPFSVVARQAEGGEGAGDAATARGGGGGGGARPPLWKLFSAQFLQVDLMARLFVNATVVAQKHWFAYPKYAAPERFAPFELAEGLFYNNALESGASAMEVALVAARNNVLLAKRHLEGVANRRWQARHRRSSSSDATRLAAHSLSDMSTPGVSAAAATWCR